MATKKRASIYKFSDHYIIHPDHTTKAGYGIATGPYVRFSMDKSSTDLAEGLREALNSGKMNVPNNKEYDTKAYLKSMGFKSLAELHKGSLLCSVDESNDTLTFFSTINVGSRDGFKFKTDKKIQIPANASVKDIGNAILEAFSKCE